MALRLRSSGNARFPLLSGVLVAVGVALACGGATTQPPTDDGGSGGGALDGGTDGGTGGHSAGGAVGSGGSSNGSGGQVVSTGGSTSGAGGAVGGAGAAPACEADSDCHVQRSGCCEPCEPVQDYHLFAYAQGMAAPDCDVVCGACEAVSEYLRTRDYFVARCIESSCQLVDLRDDYAGCETTEDCTLRDGSGCCEGCDGEGFVALSSSDYLLSCLPVPCPACASDPPADLIAYCDPQSQQCEKAIALP